MTDTYPDTSCGDVAYWGLTPTQAVRHHARLARMYSDRATRFADLSVMYARRAEITGCIGAAFAVLAVVLVVLGAVLS